MTKQYLMPASRITTGSAVPTAAGTAGDLYVRNTDPYPSGYIRIGTPAELVAFAARVNAGETSLNACLTADLDMTDVSYTSIGGDSNRYMGTFNGYGHVIRNIVMSSTNKAYKGLFGYVEGATIQNIICEDFDIPNGDVAGCLAGKIITGSSVSNCMVKNCSVSGRMAGSLFGNVFNSSVSNCCSYGCTVEYEYKTTGSGYSGGLTGAETKSSISNSYVYNCTISGDGYVGGLTAYVNSGSISNCAIYGGTNGNTLIGYGSLTPTNSYTSSSPGVTQAVFQTQGFWDGTGVSGTTYLSWDFDDIWEWDSTNSLPTLKAVSVGTVETSLYAYNGSAWKNKSITVSTSEPASSEGSDGDIWMVYTA